VHRTVRHSVLAHPHDRRRHPVAYAVGWAMLAGWVVDGVVLFPRLVDSVAYVAGAGGRATFMPTSSVQQCIPRAGCSTVTNGVLEVDRHRTGATWPGQLPLDIPFTVREHVVCEMTGRPGFVPRLLLVVVAPGPVVEPRGSASPGQWQPPAAPPGMVEQEAVSFWS
jgi:hypothetical protein